MAGPWNSVIRLGGGEYLATGPRQLSTLENNRRAMVGANERDSSQLILEALSSIKSDVGKPSGLSRRIAATSPEVLWPDCRLTLDIRFRCNEDHFKSGAIRSVPDLLDCEFRGLERIDHLSTLTKPQS